MWRRGYSGVGALLAGAAVAASAVLAVLGYFRPLLALVAIAGLGFGLEVDRPGEPRRRALGLLGVAVGFLALLVGGVYA